MTGFPAINQQRHLHYQFLHENTTESKIIEVGHRYSSIYITLFCVVLNETVQLHMQVNESHFEVTKMTLVQKGWLVQLSIPVVQSSDDRQPIGMAV